jgi:hypothetical protein
MEKAASIFVAAFFCNRVGEFRSENPESRNQKPEARSEKREVRSEK